MTRPWPAAEVWVIRGVVDHALAVYNGAQPLRAMLPWLVAWSVLGLMARGLWPLTDPLLARMRQEVEDALTRRLHAKAARLRLEAFERPDFTDTLVRAREASDPNEFLSLLTDGFRIPQAAINAAALALVVGRSDPWLVLATAALPGPLVQIGQTQMDFYTRWWLTPLLRVRMHLAALQEHPEAAKEVRIFDLAPWLLRRWQSIWWTAADVEYQQERRNNLTRAAFALLSGAGLAVSVAWAAWSVAHGRLSAGQFAASMLALQQLQAAVTTLVRSVDASARRLLGISLLFAYLDLGPEDAPGGAPVGAMGEIALEAVGFRYPQSGRPALRGITLTIPAGQRIALVGENGSGKTTLVKLLTGLFTPTEGRVLHAGRDVRGLDPASLRARTAAVFQDHLRFAAPLHDNIAYGRLERLGDRAAVQAAAGSGGADDIAGARPRGYDTVLNSEFSGGTDLSGGQWQRVAVSRGCMRDPALLILDEPTASLDPQAEADVFRRFAAMAGNRTAVVVSHRLGSARLCDRILVLREGCLVEQGTHEQPLAAGGDYARMWALQAQWYR